MTDTRIETCDRTWSPVTGCLHSCPYCYARGIARRFCKDGWICSESGATHILKEPYRYSDQYSEFCEGKIDPYPYGFDPTFHRYRLDEPWRWRGQQNVFVCSMADLFGDWIPDEWIEQVFAACAAAPQHNYMFLTKNPHGYCDRFDKKLITPTGNLWFGQSWDGENTALTDLRGCGCNNFISMEPLLCENLPTDALKWFDWVIVGAMTGPGARKKRPKREWIERIYAAADAAVIPVFMKNSLLPIMGEENMRREFPEGLRKKENA